MDARRAVVDVDAPSPDGSVADLAGFIPFGDTDVVPGDATLQLDPDGVVRTFRRPPGHLQSFGIAAAEAFTGRSHIAVPRGALIDYHGPAGTTPQLSYIDVLKGKFPASAVRGRIAIIAPTATVLADTHHVPVDSTMTPAVRGGRRVVGSRKRRASVVETAILERHDSELLERHPHWGPPLTTPSPS